MTTIVLTTLGILIAAAAALMISFYGGDLYSSGTVGADANRYMNMGANVVSAIDQYRINERSDPANMQALVQAGYLSLDSAPGPMELTQGTPGRLTIANVPIDVCDRINETFNRSTAESMSGQGASGCREGVYYTIV